MARMCQVPQNRSKRDQKQEIIAYVPIFRGSGLFKIRKILY